MVARINTVAFHNINVQNVDMQVWIGTGLLTFTKVGHVILLFSLLFFIYPVSASAQNKVEATNVISKNPNETIVDKGGRTPLAAAAAKDDLEEMKNLLAQGADPNAQGRPPHATNYTTPLREAILENQYNAFVLLVQNGADINLLDINGNRPIHYASIPYVYAPVTITTDYRILEFLIANGADIRAIGEFDMQPIHIASMSDVHASKGKIKGNPKIVEILVKSGADIEARHWGVTPFFIAATRGDYETAKKLLELGADPYITDNLGRTAQETINSGGYATRLDSTRHPSPEAYLKQHNDQVLEYKKILDLIESAKVRAK